MADTTSKSTSYSESTAKSEKSAEASTTGPTAKEKLRAWEDANLGKSAVRVHQGQIEKGYGSPFKALSPEKHAEYEALEKLIEAEAAVDAANVELSTAKTNLLAAKQAVIDAAKATEQAATEAKKAEAEKQQAAKEAAAEAV